MVDSLYKINAVVQSTLKPNWNIHPAHDTVVKKKSENSGNIDLKLTFGEKDVDIHVHTDTLHSHYEHIQPFERFEKILRNSRFSMAQRTAIQSGELGICTIALRSVVTFDKENLKYESSKCWTLASADCSVTPRYAVFVKKSGKEIPMTVKIFIGGHSVDVIPVEHGIKIKANGKVVNADTKKPFVLSENGIQLLTVTKMGRNDLTHYIIEAPLLSLTFRYTGFGINAIIPSAYRTHVCGLCGNTNKSNELYELVNPGGSCFHNSLLALH